MVSYLFLSSYNGLSSAAGEDQDLIYQVYFIADISSHWDLHGDQLRVQTRVNDLSELAKGADLRGQAVKVDHLMLGRLGRHLVVFSE
ncbi:hypothetical protein KCU81_g802, partial [Aureobasidium melanogenum]